MTIPVDDIENVRDPQIVDFNPPASDLHFDIPFSGLEGLEWSNTVPGTPNSLISMPEGDSPDSKQDRLFTSLVRHGVSSPSFDRLSRDHTPYPWQQEDKRPLSESPSRVLNDYSSVLVEYYFKEVAGIFSCYNSHLNPFRSTVSKLWQSSNSVFYVLQSMAAACLSDVVPSLHAVGYRLRHAAMTCVEADIRDCKVETDSLLTLIMLGLSASWHDANDLGHDQFKHARTLMGALTMGQPPAFLEANNKRNLRFFQEAMIYWEMLLSYVSDVSTALPLTQGPEPPSDEHNDLPQPSFPHPWTGVGREAQVLVFEVGRLVRKERLRIRNRPIFTSLADVDESYKVIQQAQGLARRLQQLQLPTEQGIVSPGDAQTPVEHLLTVAELYRLTGLLQLYRVFPDLLADLGNSSFQPEYPDMEEISPDSMNQNLATLAVEIVNLLRTLPIESATKCVQPFFFVAVASELRIPPAAEPLGQIIEGTEPSAVSPNAIEILDARKFVISRLSTFEHVLPAKPLRQMRRIVTLTWEQIDKGLADVYWMDVMTEKGWETTLG